MSGVNSVIKLMMSVRMMHNRLAGEKSLLVVIIPEAIYLKDSCPPRPDESKTPYPTVGLCPKFWLFEILLPNPNLNDSQKLSRVTPQV